MTTPSDPSAELASLAEASIELAKTPTTTSLATFWRQLAQKSIAVASRLESDLHATREKLKEADSVVKDKENWLRIREAEITTIRAQNLALEAQVGEMRDALNGVSVMRNSGAFGRGAMIEEPWMKRVDAALSRTPSTALGEIRETIVRLLEAMEMQEKRESGEYHIPGETANALWQDAKEAGKAALTTLTGEKK